MYTWFISNWAHSNWVRLSLGSIIIAFLPNDLPNYKRQAVKQHLDDHVGAELVEQAVRTHMYLLNMAAAV